MDNCSLKMRLTGAAGSLRPTRLREVQTQKGWPKKINQTRHPQKKKTTHACAHTSIAVAQENEHTQTAKRLVAQRGSSYLHLAHSRFLYGQLPAQGTGVWPNMFSRLQSGEFMDSVVQWPWKRRERFFGKTIFSGAAPKKREKRVPLNNWVEAPRTLKTFLTGPWWLPY